MTFNVLHSRNGSIPLVCILARLNVKLANILCPIVIPINVYTFSYDLLNFVFLAFSFHDIE